MPFQRSLGKPVFQMQTFLEQAKGGFGVLNVSIHQLPNFIKAENDMLKKVFKIN